FKCRYLITQNSYIIPTIPSGSLYNLPIIPNIIKHIQNFEITMNYLKLIYEITKSELATEPVGVYYSKKIKDDSQISYTINAIMIKSMDSVPIIEQNILES